MRTAQNVVEESSERGGDRFGVPPLGGTVSKPPEGGTSNEKLQSGPQLHTNPREAEAQEAGFHAYLGCFNDQRFFEAHDVLESLWLPRRTWPIGPCYKGFIQLAGAFVHLQRHCEKYPRLRPAAALLKLAQSNLEPFQNRADRLPIAEALTIIQQWLGLLELHGPATNPLDSIKPPRLLRRHRAEDETRVNDQ